MASVRLEGGRRANKSLVRVGSRPNCSTKSFTFESSDVPFLVAMLVAVGGVLGGDAFGTDARDEEGGTDPYADGRDERPDDGSTGQFMSSIEGGSGEPDSLRCAITSS